MIAGRRHHVCMHVLYTLTANLCPYRHDMIVIYTTPNRTEAMPRSTPRLLAHPIGPNLASAADLPTEPPAPVKFDAWSA